MAPTITNVALSGPTGNVGAPILKALVDCGKFKVTVLTRKEGQEVPSGVTAKVVDTNSVESITEALRGQDAFVDASSGPDPGLPGRFVEAAAAAGVYRMIAGEFSVDPRNTEARKPLVFHGKNLALQQLEKLAAEGKITWTTISNGAFLDWNLRSGFINIDIFEKKIKYLNEGNTKLAWTMLADVGTAVANALIKHEETKNRNLYISSIIKTQSDVANLAKEVLGSDGWQEEHQNMDERLKAATENMMAGKVDMGVIGDMIRWSTQVPQPAWNQQEDNKLLGVTPMSDDELRQLIKNVRAERK
ncbi:hypothetical protein IAQ61_004670 [Plenodomus lingam]|uniref:uncharacterized protein n=1 Tax=Leptosphaeria maculans TaxID=5022 RepID=UPI00332015BA|nr:hypothetical protein IAQ61_004670 [Plenodomus lingam]